MLVFNTNCVHVTRFQSNYKKEDIMFGYCVHNYELILQFQYRLCTYNFELIIFKGGRTIRPRNLTTGC